MSALFDISPSTKAKQRQRLLEALRLAPVSTLDARERLGIQHPAGRLMELRRQGWPIVTRKTFVSDAAGRPHTMALYVLEVDHGA